MIYAKYLDFTCAYLHLNTHMDKPLAFISLKVFWGGRDTFAFQKGGGWGGRGIATNSFRHALVELDSSLAEVDSSSFVETFSFSTDLYCGREHVIE